MQLEMIAKERYTCDYGHEDRTEAMSPQKFYERLIKSDFDAAEEVNRPTGIISTRIRLGKHVLGMDCDGLEALAHAEWYLKRHSIKFIRIESSPDRFWIIGDYAASFRKVGKHLFQCKGTDDKWLKMCLQRGRFTFRAFPKRHHPTYPRFIDEPLSRETAAGEWAYHFQSWYRSWYFFQLVQKYCGFKPFTAYPPVKGGNYCTQCGAERKENSGSSKQSITFQ